MPNWWQRRAFLASPPVLDEAFGQKAASPGNASRRGPYGRSPRSAKPLFESARDVPGLAYANLAFVLGHAELVRGDIPAAVKLLNEALAGAEKHEITKGLRAASCFTLAEAHAKLGQPDAAKDAITQARGCVPVDYLFMQTAFAVASGGQRVPDRSDLGRPCCR